MSTDFELPQEIDEAHLCWMNWYVEAKVKNIFREGWWVFHLSLSPSMNRPVGVCLRWWVPRGRPDTMLVISVPKNVISSE